MVLVKESDGSVWVIDNPESLRGLEGRQVRAEVKIDVGNKAVHIKKVTEAGERIVK